MSLALGQRLGPYEVVSPLGAGGMGEVYRARDTRLERTVALKILPNEFSCDPVRKRRFEQEAKTISSLNHPHICMLHDIGHQDGIDFLVMECVEGETLAKRLEKGGASFNVGQSQRLFVAPVSPFASTYDVAPDGQRFVMSASPEEAEPPLVLMVNWTSELKKK